MTAETVSGAIAGLAPSQGLSTPLAEGAPQACLGATLIILNANKCFNERSVALIATALTSGNHEIT
jgi:hypothetical protein